VLTVKSEMAVAGLTGQEITDFLLDPRDDRYQDWWPGAHREFHILERCSGAGHVGDVVIMDEYIGPRHVRMTAEVIEVVPGEKLVWQLRRWRLRLPIRLTLSLQTGGGDVRLSHIITAGWSGRAAAFDRLWRLYFSRTFASEMDRHVHTEFPLLRDLLHREQLRSTACRGRAVSGEAS